MPGLSCRLLSVGRVGVVFALLGAQLGCSANCLRNTDCDDAHVCRRNACVLPPEAGPDGGLAEMAGSSGMAGFSGSSGLAGATGSAGSADLGSAGSAGARSANAGAGGASTLPRENLDAATDADASDTGP